MDYIRTLPPSRPTVFAPKLLEILSEGYSWASLSRDAIAGLTVAVVALPLSMAIGIASGATPAQGLVTAIVAGFVISALGGSRFQIGGPTAAFIVVVFATIQRHGYDGLLLATLIAGTALLVVGFLKLGTYIKYIPYPVVTGFTAGIAVSIFASQLKDLLGLQVSLPGDFIPKIALIVRALPQTNPGAVVVAIVALGIIVGLHYLRPRAPGFLIALIAAAFVTHALDFDVATIGSAFGGIPRGLPIPSLPAISLAKLQAVLPDGLTIALLAGIESLLSAVVADGMTGRRHRSNVELVAQGAANLVSVAFGGLPATGAIARTATNIRAGARTPLAGVIHSLFLLLFVFIAAPLLSYIPLAALAAILAWVAWNISEFSHIRAILGSASNGDRLVLAATFLLTVLVDLTVAIEVGVVLSAIVFMHRMANAVEISEAPPPKPETYEAASSGAVVVYRINGPFFFGTTHKLATTLDRIGEAPKKYVLDLAGVPLVDSSAAAMLKGFVAKAGDTGTEVVLAGASPTVLKSLTRFGVCPPLVRFAASVPAATETQPI